MRAQTCAFDWRLALVGAMLEVAAASAATTAQESASPVLDPAEVRGAGPRTSDPSDAAGERAVQRLRAAAGRDANGRDAAWLLGLLALHGLGMPQDAVQAQSWFRRAQQLGHPLAPAGLAWCAIEGCEGPPQPAAARRWLAALRRVDPGRALFLEWVLETRLAPLQLAPPDLRGQSLPPTPRRDLLARAARQGNVHAQIELGIESAASGRLQEAAGIFRGAAPRSPAAAANEAMIRERLQPRKANGTQASQGEQLFLQGQRYHRGEGVPANYTEAIRLYQMAAAKGSARARRMLELVFSRPAPGGGVDIAWMQQVSRMDVSALGAVTLLPQTAPATLQRDATPLYDLVPAEWRAPAAPKRR